MVDFIFIERIPPVTGSNLSSKELVDDANNTHINEYFAKH